MPVAVPHPIPEPLAELIADRFKVLADPTRLRLLDELRDGSRTVKDLTQALGSTTQQNVSKHLGVLHQHGMVSRRREGTSARYSISDPDVFALCELVCGGLQQRHSAFQRALDAAA
jgi:DNA-binding transcriptional ArsR family regulator